MMARDEVHVFHFPLSVPAKVLEEAALVLSTQERERADSFRYARNREEFIAARAGLRCILGAVLQLNPGAVDIQPDEHGKPLVPQTCVQFNLSHAGDCAVVAVAEDRALGIDIEVIRELPDALEIAERFFAPHEVQRLQALSGKRELVQAFFECWTRKEAFVKALGLGLSYPLESFEVSFFPDPDAWLSGLQTGRWLLQNMEMPNGYAGALVTEKRDSPVIMANHTCTWHGETTTNSSER